MSEALWEHGGLRFWNARELLLRDNAMARFVDAVREPLLALNGAWNFERIEGPMLMPRKHINANYDGDDVWLLQAKLGDDEAVLRPETTPSSYVAADRMLKDGSRKPPLCVYQIGKSFRREEGDGNTAAKLRFKEFTQLEFQCIYKEGTKADYRTPVVESIYNTIARLSNLETRTVPSDRLPSYSTKTDDVEVHWNDRWTEMCSISDRTDFPGYLVLEAAIGMDRIVAVHS